MRRESFLIVIENAHRHSFGDFMKCNIDDIPEFGAAYNIKTIPTFIIFKDGVVVDKIIGGVSKSFLEKKLQNV